MGMDFIPEAWLIETMKYLQAAEDAHYLSSGTRAVFEQAKANWIEANVRNRDAGLPITEFTAPVPQRVVFFYTSRNTYSQRLEADPGATLPELPAAPVVTPSTPHTEGGAERDAQVLQLLSMILAKLIGLESRK